MSIQDAWQKVFSFVGSRPVVVGPSEEHLSSDAGLLPLRQFDEKLGLTTGFSAQLGDRRQRPSHAFLEMVRSRVFGILAGYEDQNDHDALRSDAVFKLVAGRLPDAADLASQPTLSRFENSITPRMLLQLEEWFIQQFVHSFAEIPAQLTLDADVYDDPTHGQQQLTFFHGFYEQYQYLVRVFTCAQNDHVILPVLLHGTARASLAVEPDLRRIVQALRAGRPDVRIHFRIDSGFAAPSVYDECETLGIEYTIGLPMNPVLKRESEACLQQAVAAFEQTGEPQRMFVAFDYQAASWRMPRWVVVKCEANAQGTNRRAIVTNRPGARVCFQGVYDDYAERGESENRNKELKRGLLADRLSDHRYMANCFRIYGQLFSDVLALFGTPDPGPGAANPSRTRVAQVERGSAARGAGRLSATTWFQSAAESRSTRRRSSLHLAADAHQSRRLDHRLRPQGCRQALWLLAVSGLLSSGQ